MNNEEKLITVINQQVREFLLDAGEFYPFGTYINRQSDIIPLGAYTGSEYPPYLELIDMLERYLQTKVSQGDSMIGALAIDVVLKEDGKVFDAIEIRFFEQDNNYIKRFRYNIANAIVSIDEID